MFTCAIPQRHWRQATMQQQWKISDHLNGTNQRFDRLPMSFQDYILRFLLPTASSIRCHHPFQIFQLLLYSHLPSLAKIVDEEPINKYIDKHYYLIRSYLSIWYLYFVWICHICTLPWLSFPQDFEGHRDLASRGMYSPKSAIQPDNPKSNRFLTIISM